MNILVLAALALVETQGPVTIDWTSGAVVVEAGAGPSLRDPSPQVARVAAERAARKLATTRLLAAIDKLPVAGGGTVAKKLTDARREWLAKQADQAPIARMRHASDGGIEIQIRFPMFRVAQALSEEHSVPRAGARIAIVKGGAPALLPGGDLRFFVSVADAKKEKDWLGPSPQTLKLARLTEGDLRGGPVAVVIEK